MKNPTTPSILSPSRKSQRVAEKGSLKFLIAFTLIELLVVISIIAVLAGLMFPAVRGVRNAARSAAAKNDIVQMVNAIKSFYVEYGQYPNTAVKPTAASNESLMTCLLGSGTAGGNTRQIRYLEVGGTSNKSKSGLTGGSNGSWVDPWGKAYAAAWDDNYDGLTELELSPTSGGTSKFNVQMGAVAASYGVPAGENPYKSGSNPILSWQ